MNIAVFLRRRIGGTVVEGLELFSSGVLQAAGVLQNDTILGVP